jgi:hypothetical protein
MGEKTAGEGVYGESAGDAITPRPGTQCVAEDRRSGGRVKGTAAAGATPDGISAGEAKSSLLSVAAVSRDSDGGDDDDDDESRCSKDDGGGAGEDVERTAGASSANGEGRSALRPPSCVFRCCFMLSLRANRFGQRGHTTFFSPVCRLAWRDAWPDVVNISWQLRLSANWHG